MTHATTSEEIASLARKLNHPTFTPELLLLSLHVRAYERALDESVAESIAISRARAEAMRAGNVVCLARDGIAARMGR